MISWQYQGKEITTYQQAVDILGYEPVAFIYEIILSGSKGEVYTYYGQKTMKTDAKRIVGQKELKEKGKGNFRKYKSKKGGKKGQWIYFSEGVQETWKDYISSSEIVKEMIADGVPYKKTILEFTNQQGLLNYLEFKKIICSGCMEDENCLNLRCGNFYSKNIIKALEKNSK